MNPDDSIPGWLTRWQAGDPEAAGLLFANYGKRLTRLAEQHLSRRLAGRVDGEDVVQSVFRTFFRRSAAGEFRIDSTVEIWRLLVKITLLKARATARFHMRTKRDVRAEVDHGEDAWLFEATAVEPGPAEAVALVDQIESLLRGLPPLYAELLDLRLQGIAAEDIGSRLNVSRRTVYRALTLLQQRLNEQTRLVEAAEIPEDS